MATKIRTRRLVANPRRSRKRKRSARRRMSAKQIKHFGTKAQKAALKRRNRTKYSRPKKKAIRRVSRKVTRKVARRKVARRAAPLRKRRSRKAPVKRKRRNNPALIVTLGAVNPTNRRKTVARRRKTKRATKPRRRRRNATRVVVTAPKRQYNVRRRRRANPRRRKVSRRRNPQLSFGRGAPMSRTITAVGGGLIGVAAAKFLPTLAPAGLVSSNLMRTIATGVAAWVAGWLASKANKDFGDAVLFGGLMQTGSSALNAFLPSVAGALGISGLGAFADAQFSVPENPIMRGARAPVPRVNNSGVGRAFGSAF